MQPMLQSSSVSPIEWVLDREAGIKLDPAGKPTCTAEEANEPKATQNTLDLPSSSRDQHLIRH